MGLAVNLTPYAVGELFGSDHTGKTLFVVVVKATFSFARGDQLEPIVPDPIAARDRYAGDPARTGLLVAAELGLPKPRIDVLLAGALRFRAPLTEGQARMEVGHRIDKRLLVFGDRFWLPGVVSELSPSRPHALAALPIAWERCAGGADADNPQLYDRRNPAGCTHGKTAAEAQGRPLPNFEDPRDPVTTWKSRPAPSGFGPLAAHWQPRAALAGTYDQRWREGRAPLLPEDFAPAFLNCAPLDQQLGTYLPGEEVRLTGMTAHGFARFALPELAVPVTFVTRDVIEERQARVDTVVIEPAESRVSVIARAACAPRAGVTSVREAFVGSLSAGRRKALELGKVFLDLRSVPFKRGAA